MTGTTNAPAEGMRFVGMDVVAENTGATVYDLVPTELYLRTAPGDLYLPGWRLSGGRHHPAGPRRSADGTRRPHLRVRGLSDPGGRDGGGHRLLAGERATGDDRRTSWATGRCPPPARVITPAPAASVTPAPARAITDAWPVGGRLAVARAQASARQWAGALPNARLKARLKAASDS